MRPCLELADGSQRVGCTLLGTGTGGLYASSKNSDIQVQQGYKPRTSVAKSMGVGGAIGLVLELALVAVALNSSSFGH